jgi:hypothetical protein
MPDIIATLQAIGFFKELGQAGLQLAGNGQPAIATAQDPDTNYRL